MIAVDWGTSQVRAYQVDASGRINAARTEAKGILAVGASGFPSVLEAIVGDWLGTAGEPIVMSGMVGSRQGWVEVPYVACPAGPAEVAAGIRALRWHDDRPVLVCPGLTCRDRCGVPDVMRGEEVQIYGALASVTGRAIATVCLPGTHSKHAHVRGGVVEGFVTHMTGEVFAVMQNHSILRATMTEGPADPAAFDDGVRRARQPDGILHHLFGVRTRSLLGELSPAGSADYLSGLLIGHEIAVGALVEPILVVGAPSLTARYVRAFELFGLEALAFPADMATAKGLYMVNALVQGSVA